MKRGFSIGVAVVAALAGTARADEVTDWQQVLQNMVRQAPNNPPHMARGGAMMSTAVFNAINAVDQTHFSYGGFADVAGPGTSRRAAAVQAAYDVLSHLYPAQQAQLDTALLNSLAGIEEAPAEVLAGRSLGSSAASHIIALRSGDGSDPPNPPYTPGGNPGDWRPTAPDPFAAGPVYGNVTPWGIPSGSAYRPDRLSSHGTMADFLASQEYADAYNDVKDNGRIDSWTPADEEYQIAFFWGNDRNGTYKPPGHLNYITQVFADREFSGLPDAEQLSKNARLFALVNMAMADGGIAAWDCKYLSDFDLWRPITGIHEADTDGNAMTVTDPTWEPLNHVDPDGMGPMLADPFSPPFPAYVSGHATFGAAQAGIMRLFFGSDTFADLEIGTDDPYVPGLTRTFTSWEDMARENGRSRVYLGVHWQFDADDGYTMGTAVAEYIFANFLQQVPAPGVAGLSLGLALLGLRRRR